MMLAAEVLNLLQQMETLVPPPEGQHHSFTRDAEHLVLTIRTGVAGSICFFLSRQEVEETTLQDVVAGVMTVFANKDTVQ